LEHQQLRPVGRRTRQTARQGHPPRTHRPRPRHHPRLQHQRPDQPLQGPPGEVAAWYNPDMLDVETDLQLEEPKVHRLTVEEYQKLGEVEWFWEHRVELIDGEIIEMPPKKDLHTT